MHHLAPLPVTPRSRLWIRRFFLLPLLMACGCASMSNIDKGVLAGGTIGAGTGALLGSASHHGGAGAIIGGVIGAVTGGMIGNSVDRTERRQEEFAAAQAARALGMTDIIYMAQQHISDDVIINQIRTTGSTYNLSAADITWLKSNGVSDAVVGEMQMTAYRAPRRVYVPAPIYPAPPPVYYVPESPPVSVGVGIGFRGR